jgi:phage baseplate assembly protein W
MYKSVYVGFSTDGTLKSFRKTNLDLVNRDLMNHIFTLKGERVMMPDFGTRIPLMAFEPLDQKTLDAIEEDLRAVAAYDPRVKLLDLAVMALPDNNAVIALLDLQYVELNVTDTLRIEVPVNS